MTTPYTPPRNPLDAVTHPDPYPFYREMVARRPLAFDESLGVWVAASASAVRAMLTSDSCRVRPVAEPVPAPLRDSSAGDIFGHLARMNDGPIHASLKSSIMAALSSLDVERLRQRSAYWSEALSGSLDSTSDPGGFVEFAYHLPVYVLGDLLGIPVDQLPDVARWIADLAGCFAPQSNQAGIVRGLAAAPHLLNAFAALHGQEAPVGDDRLYSRFAIEASRRGQAADATIVANGIGLLWQSYEATAGLIGATALLLARRPDIAQMVRDDASALPLMIQETLRYDPPIQNTRRFLAEDAVVVGQQMHKGEIVLVLLAAANHDSAANPEPARFGLFRRDRVIFTFGVGRHACPGQTLAATIAEEGIRRWLLSNAPLPLESLSYQVSANARLPLLAPQPKGAQA
jgi:cytochrome P450